MDIEVNVSIGEVVDKLTILEIKLLKINDQNKLSYVKNEKEFLIFKLESLNLLKSKNFQELKQKLFETNIKLWEIEDKIREYEKNKDFGDKFVDLARSVYITNDKRFQIKDEINKSFNSEIREVKSYEEY